MNRAVDVGRAPTVFIAIVFAIALQRGDHDI
jgi:hypothetical protein